MKKLIVSPPARADLREIWDYIAGDSLNAADTLSETFYEKFELLRATPEAGRQRSDLKSSLRSFPVGRYVIFYRVSDGAIEIVRVLHGARDVDSLFG
ncbi:toxin ParE1/3/4 [Abditibacterium utsteinense]|uniref:Toxin n=1 Tax=Abditibacterium utsteinense TaxID=1960156 RepID=A0A2S8SP11_9BACT|nr:type II toxin-antitoxin system RelE/ParE family toxin [Abditibacterium utsteinense]PQV62519.1 toxin ParE1/3/4 [Abditibacterium utsteinense]